MVDASTLALRLVCALLWVVVVSASELEEQALIRFSQQLGNFDVGHTGLHCFGQFSAVKLWRADHVLCFVGHILQQCLAWMG